MTYEQQQERSIEIKNAAIEAVKTGNGIKEAYELFLTDELASKVSLDAFVSYFGRMIQAQEERAQIEAAHFTV